MGLLARLFGREQRAASVKTSDPYLSEFLGMRDAMSGAAVSSERAGGLAVAYRCIQVRAEGLASVPLKLYRRAGDAREPATDHPLYGVLHDRFNDGMTAFEGRELLSAWADLYGNAFARIESNGRGQVVALYPMAPGAVTVEKLASGRLRYRWQPPNGSSQVVLADEMLHIRHRSRDGALGVSPIAWARESVGLALAEQEHAASALRNGLRLSGAFTFPTSLNDEQFKRLRLSAEQKFSGPANAGRFLVLDGGADFKPFSMSPKDAEFLESRKLSDLAICRLFGVPPTVAGITDNATYSNTEQEGTALVVRCLAPWARRFEQVMTQALLTANGRTSLFIEHDLSGLLRGDVKSRYEAYAVGRQWGWLSPNDIRRLENMGPIADGDVYHAPLNMAPLGAPAATGGA